MRLPPVLAVLALAVAAADDVAVEDDAAVTATGGAWVVFKDTLAMERSSRGLLTVSAAFFLRNIILGCVCRLCCLLCVSLYCAMRTSLSQSLF